MRSKLTLTLCLVLSVLISPATKAIGGACTGNFVNPISDVCWECMLPMTLGSVPMLSSRYPDTSNPSAPISYCPKPPPIYLQIGLNIGYWEPSTLTDVTRIPYCMVNMDMEMSISNKTNIGGNVTVREGEYADGAFYHAHFYTYPLMYWLDIISSTACMATDAFGVGYMTELDPTWEDDELAFVLNPEAILFGNPATQLACVAESIITSLGTALPLDPLFWCLGSQGSAYPLTGTTGYQHSTVQAATLIMQRINYKLHRQGLVWQSFGADGAICYQAPSPILPKHRYRYQMSATIPRAHTCYPYTTTSIIWEAGHDNPVTGGNFGFINWKKRNCVFL